MAIVQSFERTYGSSLLFEDDTKTMAFYIYLLASTKHVSASYPFPPSSANRLKHIMASIGYTVITTRDRALHEIDLDNLSRTTAWQEELQKGELEWLHPQARGSLCTRRQHVLKCGHRTDFMDPYICSGSCAIPRYGSICDAEDTPREALSSEPCQVCHLTSFIEQWANFQCSSVASSQGGGLLEGRRNIVFRVVPGGYDYPPGLVPVTQRVRIDVVSFVKREVSAPAFGGTHAMESPRIEDARVVYRPLWDALLAASSEDFLQYPVVATNNFVRRLASFADEKALFVLNLDVDPRSPPRDSSPQPLQSSAERRRRALEKLCATIMGVGSIEEARVLWTSPSDLRLLSYLLFAHRIPNVFALMRALWIYSDCSISKFPRELVDQLQTQLPHDMESLRFRMDALLTEEPFKTSLLTHLPMMCKNFGSGRMTLEELSRSKGMATQLLFQMNRFVPDSREGRLKQLGRTLSRALSCKVKKPRDH